MSKLSSKHMFCMEIANNNRVNEGNLVQKPYDKVPILV